MNCPQKLRPRPFGFFERAHSIQKEIEFVFVYVAILRQRTRQVSNLQTWQKQCNRVAPFESTWRSTWCKVFLTCIKDQFTKQDFLEQQISSNIVITIFPQDSASPTSSKLLVRCSLIKRDATWKSRGSDSKNLTKTWARSLSQRAQREAAKSPECNRSKHWKWSPDTSYLYVRRTSVLRGSRKPENQKSQSSKLSSKLQSFQLQRVFSKCWSHWDPHHLTLQNAWLLPRFQGVNQCHAQSKMALASRRFWFPSDLPARPG